MIRKVLAPALAATLLLAACDKSPTGITAASDTDDYALLMFGESGSALEGTMGPAPVGEPFDGASAYHRLPDRLALTPEQADSIRALRQAFKDAHADELAALREIFLRARAAREAGASREEVHAILMEGRDIARALRPFVIQLRADIWDVLTPAQREWLFTHRFRPFVPRPIANP
jgi:Spy/CpxP family protein refolding chaperone